MLTEICFTPVQDGPSLAEGHVVIEGRFKVSGIRVVRGTHGLFVAWPSFREAPDRGSPRFPIFEILTDRDRCRCCHEAISRTDSSGLCWRCMPTATLVG